MQDYSIKAIEWTGAEWRTVGFQIIIVESEVNKLNHKKMLARE